jgi:hypothetical protein
LYGSAPRPGGRLIVQLSLILLSSFTWPSQTCVSRNGPRDWSQTSASRTPLFYWIPEDTRLSTVTANGPSGCLAATVASVASSPRRMMTYFYVPTVLFIRISMIKKIKNSPTFLKMEPVFLHRKGIYLAEISYGQIQKRIIENVNIRIQYLFHS